MSRSTDPVDPCFSDWKDFRQFRVIVVQRTDWRRQNLLKKMQENLKHRMFWLTTEELYKKEIDRMSPLVKFRSADAGSRRSSSSTSGSAAA